MTSSFFGLNSFLIPALPAPWGTLKIILLLVFFIHLLLVNVLVGSTLIALVRCWGGKSAAGAGLAYDTAHMTKTLALAVNFGVAPYLFVQALYSDFLYSAGILMAFWWLGVAAFVMMAYYGLYLLPSQTARAPLLTVIAALLLVTALVLSANSALMLRPESWLAWFSNPHGSLLIAGDPTLLPRYLHILLGCLGVGGLFRALRGLWLKKAGPAQSEERTAAAEARIREGLAWFIYPTLLQGPVGLWFLLSLPDPVRSLFLGGAAYATGALLVALAGMLLALLLARLGRVRATAGVLLGVFLLMVCIRDMVRDAMLQPYMAPGQALSLEKASGLLLPRGQAAGFALFLACCALGAAALVYLARAALAAFAPVRPERVEE